MRRGIFVIVFLVFISAIVGCSKDRTMASRDRFDLFLGLWGEQNFEEMYDMLSSDAREEFPPEQFIDRYKKIYGDLGVSKVEFTY
ncbi:MAG: penicillin-binding transpeptidase domain-containing protein, partial [Tissierellia bacterium]|nr:penicillin-binding transpeptidase domain-containing protein [Tissierellia bacterium]